MSSTQRVPLKATSSSPSASTCRAPSARNTAVELVTLPSANASAVARADTGGLVLPARPGWREVLGMTLLPPLGLAFIVPADPLLLESPFPWLVLLPVLIGVQHGALAATVSSALLVGAGALHQLLSGGAGFETLAAFAAGCLSAGVIAGHFHDRVQAQLARSSRAATEGARRLSRLGRAHAVLELSHQKLEERLAARSWSLVSAFEDARHTLASATSISAIGEVVLSILSNHAMVQSATLFTVGERDGRLGLVPTASIGQPPGVDVRHRLVQRALETGRLVALDAESVDAGADDSVLAVAPLGSASGEQLGLIVIHEQPIIAFQAENLKNLAALAALLADLLEEHFVDVAPESGTWLSLAPERSLRALATSRPEEPIEALGAELEPSAGDDTAGPDFVGTRTGTHRRRGVAQSA